MTTQYAAGFNLPGYLPDNPPDVFDSLEEAKASIVWWIEQYIDCMHECEEDAADAERTLAEFEAVPAQTCNVYVGDYVYWIKRIIEAK